MTASLGVILNILLVPEIDRAAAATYSGFPHLFHFFRLLKSKRARPPPPPPPLVT